MRESIDQLAVLKRNIASIAGVKLLSGDKRIATGHGSLEVAVVPPAEARP